MKQSLGLKTSQQLALTPQLQQAIKLLQMSTVELKEELEQAVSDNPLLEMEESPDSGLGKESKATVSDESLPTETSDQKSSSGQLEDTRINEWSSIKPNKGKIGTDEQNESRDTLGESPISLTQHLQGQLSLMTLSNKERAWVEILIRELDSDGYLREELKELERPFAKAFEEAYSERLSNDELSIGLKLLQSFDPVGVGARNLSECLKLQLLAKKNGYETEVYTAAVCIVENHLNLLAQHNISGLVKATGFSKDIVHAAEIGIRQLNPKPGSFFKEDVSITVIPDTVAFRKEDGRWSVKLNEAAMPKLKLHQDYATVLKNDSGAKGALGQQLQEARWMLKNIQQRFETILKVSQTIVEVQQDFFDDGPRAMRPLVLRDIAIRCDLHESTVSRVTNQKYILTPMGCFELKYFFGSHVTTEDGGVASGTAIKEQIKEWIQKENPEKPFSDQSLSDRFGDGGVVIARRTVAKYREALKIPSASIRKRR